MKDFISTNDLSVLAGITPRAAKKAIHAVVTGEWQAWRGAKLVVRQMRGRGGRSGWSYEVSVDSLPLDLRQNWRELHGAVEVALKVDETTSAICQWRYALINPALAAEKGSAERARIVRETAQREHVTPKGQRKRVGERTLQEWIRRFEQPAPNGGFAGLMRAEREDKGEATVIVTRKWDAAVALDDAAKHRIGDELRQYVRGLLKAGEGRSFTEQLAAAKLCELTRAAGYEADDAKLITICAIPANLIQAELVYKKVDTFRNDRSTYEKRRPRIQRSREGLAPNDIWVGDVHPVDILYRRADGSTATIRGIGWLDLATNRLHITWLALEPRKGVRNFDVISSFVRAVNAWGVPRALYLDNGSEYNWAEFIGDALKLINGQGNRAVGDVAFVSDRASAITRAMAHNPQAKPIENIFGVLEKKHFSVVKGYIGGDRMKKRTQNHGRAPEPFDGTPEELCALLDALVAVYNAAPQRGRALKEISPNAALAKAIGDGWKPIGIEANALRVAFSKEEPREVRQGHIECKGLWTSRELQAYQGDRVTVLIPKYEDWARLPVRDEGGKIFTYVERAHAFGIFNPAGAIEANAQARTHQKGVIALDRSAPNVDRLAERLKLSASLPDAPVLPSPVARITGSSEGEEVALHVGLAPNSEIERARRADAKRESEEREEIARQKRNQATLEKIKANKAKQEQS